jgi:hypothetical protein
MCNLDVDNFWGGEPGWPVSMSSYREIQTKWVELEAVLKHLETTLFAALGLDLG